MGICRNIAISQNVVLLLYCDIIPFGILFPVEYSPVEYSPVEYSPVEYYLLCTIITCGILSPVEYYLLWNITPCGTLLQIPTR